MWNTNERDQLYVSGLYWHNRILNREKKHLYFDARKTSCQVAQYFSLQSITEGFIK